MVEYLEGIIERITYQAEETGYTVARLQPEGRRSEPVTVVGQMASVSPGESVRLEGSWVTHPQYGRQFKFTGYETVYPATVEGIRKYLGSGLIKGIGPVTARRIVSRFGLDTLEVIENDPERLIEVPGTGPKRVEMIKRGWEEQRRIKDVMLFLQSHNVSTTYAVKIYKHYGDQAISIVLENPYRLERDIWGIGFLTADRIAKSLGVDENSRERIKAGIRYVLDQSSEQGHVFLPMEELLKATEETLKVDVSLLPWGLEELVEEEGIKLDEDRVYLPPFYWAEVGVSSDLHRLIKQELPHERIDLKEEMPYLERRIGIRFAENQKKAIKTGAESKVMVITGGPGTGKTTITRGIINLFERREMRILLCSPTGRAAKRLSEATGKPAKTIHRMLGYNPSKGGFQKDREDPLNADLIIADESSMIDTLLMHSLLKAIPDRAKLILVGDADQLPSVGAGNILRDIIDSGVLPVVRLTHIFRQAQKSQIVVNAHRINQGKFPYIDNQKARDFFFIEEEDPEAIPDIIEKLCIRSIPEYLGCDSIDDIQVLSPMYKGETGVTNLNNRLQSTLNPNSPGYRRGNTEYRVGDKVMQIRNNYEKMVFNGDIGRVLEIDLEEQTIEVLFDELVSYDFSELDELVLAYAVSVHKAQGSEYKAVVMPVTTQHYMLLQRNLLYTAVTRARELVVLVGTRKALWIAVKNDKVAERYTDLADRLSRRFEGSQTTSV